MKRNERSLPGRWRAILLVLSFLVPFVQFAFTPDAEAASAVRACCRMMNNGKHQCTMHGMMMGEMAGDMHGAMTSSTQAEQSSFPAAPTMGVVQVTERCPCAPTSPSNGGSLLPAGGSRGYVVHAVDEMLQAAADAGDDAVFQTYANPKRGPPSFRPIA